MSSDDNYDAQADLASQDNDYTSRPGQKDGPIPVQSDSTNVESGVDTASADSDEQLARDDKDAIDQSNVVEGRTRGAGPSGGYREPGDEEGLPGPEDGTSSAA